MCGYFEQENEYMKVVINFVLQVNAICSRCFVEGESALKGF